MAVTHLKTAVHSATTDAVDVEETVRKMLAEVEAEGEAAARRFAMQFDGYEGNLVLTRDEIEAASAQVSPQVKEDIQYAYDNIRRFAEAQMATISDFEIELRPGLFAGQRAIPCNAVGCYVPGGTLRAYCLCDDDRDDGQGGGMPSHRRMLATAKGQGRASCHHLHG